MIVDINGNPLHQPLKSNRMIAFKVAKVLTRENRGGNEIYHHLELMSAEELSEYCE